MTIGQRVEDGESHFVPNIVTCEGKGQERGGYWGCPVCYRDPYKNLQRHGQTLLGWDSIWPDLLLIWCGVGMWKFSRSFFPRREYALLPLSYNNCFSLVSDFSPTRPWANSLRVARRLTIFLRRDIVGVSCSRGHFCGHCVFFFYCGGQCHAPTSEDCLVGFPYCGERYIWGIVLCKIEFEGGV